MFLISCVGTIDAPGGDGERGGGASGTDGGKADDPDDDLGPGDDPVAEVRKLQLTASGASCLGSPAGEDAPMLVDGSVDTKFLGRHNAVAVQLDAGSPQVVTRYALTAANDFPERDPARWALSGSNDRVSWTTIDAQRGHTFAERFERSEFAVSDAPAYRYYQLSLENRSGGDVQISEVELHGYDPLVGAASAPPASPADVTTSAHSFDGVSISWSDGSDDEVLFRIEHSTDGATWNELAIVGSGVESYVAAGLPAATHHFRVLAENAAGLSQPSGDSQVVVSGVSSAPSGGGTLYQHGGYSLLVTDIGGGTSAQYESEIVREFFTTYPEMAQAFRPDAPKHLTLTFDPGYDGVAYASGTDIVIATDWTVGQPDDIDVIVHEGFHVVQGYNFGEIPGWTTEGLADYARFRHGRLNRASCWTMQRYAATQSHTDAYGVTARFFLWVNDHVKPGLPEALDDTLRAGAYTSAFWTQETQKTVETLWAEYAAQGVYDPVVYR